jgi:hypothetical protein
MCYTDGGSKDPGAITWNCLDGFDHFDCDHDTYFDAAIGAGQGRGTGSYLDTHWNIGECYVRFVVNAACSGGGDTTAPVMGTVSAAVASGYQVGSTLATRVSWSATDASGISRYSLWLSADGGVSWTDRSASLSSATATSIVFSLTPGTSYEFAVEAKDPAGNWSKFAYTPTFKPAIYDDTSVTYSTSWSRYAWSSAFGGYEVGSKTAAATASFTFTGLGVGWVAPKATNRGQAYVYIDGTYIGTVDLYSATTSAKPVVLSRYWTTRGTHTMTVKVVGTSGRPQVDVDAFATLR